MLKTPKTKLIKILAQILILMSILAILLFLPAGRWDWPQAWALIFFLVIYFLLYVFIGIFQDPEQTRERSHMAANVKRWDKILMRVYTALLPTVFIVAGLDWGRFEWSRVPIFVQVLAWIGLALAGALILWTVHTNTYLSRYARIQDDRHQRVITSGPYRLVRHPMYLGILVLFFCLGPALGSLYALIPGLLIAVIFTLRTAKEDKMLQEELPGYKVYVKSVRYRLFPGIW
jgi:protein-S-isoprenylcysteine O-methyltransferase Ste14